MGTREGRVPETSVQVLSERSLKWTLGAVDDSVPSQLLGSWRQMVMKQ